MAIGSGPSAVTFGARLRELRTEAGLTQEELAERAQLTPHGISALERGTRRRPYPHTVRALAAALGLDEQATAELVASLPRRTATAATPEVQQSGETVPTAVAGLTVPTTELFGREEEVATLVGLIRRDERLVTVVGPGGVGKTRVAVAVAAAVQQEFVDGVLQVALAHTTEPGEVVAAVADALAVPGADAVRTAAALAEHLQGRRMMVVLDNLEQVADVGPTVAEIVGACPRLAVLVTSRVPLRVRGETVHVLGPLGLAPRDARTLGHVAGSPAGAMFLDRARSAAAHLPLSDADAPAVAEICRRLAGIPLALELAAAHLATLGPTQLLARLDQALQRDGAADLPDRQRTLHATLEWSRGLLSPGEERLLRRLSVFRGGFTLEAAEAVGGGEGDTWGQLGRLVEHSLVQVARGSQGDTRYRMLEPVAQYAASLLPADELREARDRFAAHMLALAEEAAPQYTQSKQLEWLQRLDLEDANLAEVMRWTLGEGEDPVTAARLGWALWLFWWLRGRQQTGRTAMEAVLRHELPPEVRTTALLTHGAMTFALGDLVASEPSWREAERLAKEVGIAFEANGRAGLGIVALAGGDLATARPAFEKVLEMTAGRDEWIAAWVAGLSEIWLGTVLFLQGEHSDARRHLEQGLRRARERGDVLTTYVALFNLAQFALAEGDRESAGAALTEAVDLSVQTRDSANLAFVLDGLAVLAAHAAEHDRVPLLVGAAEAMRESAGGHVYGYYVPDAAQFATATSEARQALGDDAYDDLLDAGRQQTFDQAVGTAYGR